jgi:hypothetical protein
MTDSVYIWLTYVLQQKYVKRNTKKAMTMRSFGQQSDGLPQVHRVVLAMYPVGYFVEAYSVAGY